MVSGFDDRKQLLNDKLSNLKYQVITAFSNVNYSVTFIGYYLRTNFEISFQLVFSSPEHNTLIKLQTKATPKAFQFQPVCDLYKSYSTNSLCAFWESINLRLKKIHY